MKRSGLSTRLAPAVSAVQRRVVASGAEILCRCKSILGFRGVCAVLACAALALAAVLTLPGDARSAANTPDAENSRILTGYAIAPVELDLRGRNRALVGLGSYLVNSQCACSECHTWPQFADGGNPFLGEPEEINAAGYLGGGRFFGPVIVSNNITPDPDTGLPAGMTFAEFDTVMRTGIDRDHSAPPVPSPANDLLQVMPWPVFKDMTERDMRAIYEYLSAIPSLP